MSSNKIEVQLQLLDKLTSPLNKAAAGVQNVSSRITSALKFGAVIAGAAIVVSKIMDMTKASIEFADSIDKNSQKLQMSTKEYQQWSYVIGNAGGDINNMSSTFSKLNDLQGKASEGNNAALKSFNDLGVIVVDTNGKMRSTGDVFNDVVKGLTNIKNPAERAAKAKDLLGKSSIDLAPLLNMTSDAIEKQKNEAESLGLVLRDSTVRALAETNDIMARVGTSQKVLSAEMTRLLAPALDGIFESANKAVAALNKLIFKDDKIITPEKQLKQFEDRLKYTTDAIKELKQMEIDGNTFRLDAGGKAQTNITDYSKEIADYESEVRQLNDSIALYKANPLIKNPDSKEDSDKAIKDLKDKADKELKAKKEIAKSITNYGEIAAKQAWDSKQAQLKEQEEAEAKGLETAKEKALQVLDAKKMVRDLETSSIRDGYKQQSQALTDHYQDLKDQYAGNEAALTAIVDAETLQRKELSRQAFESRLQASVQLYSSLSGAITTFSNLETDKNKKSIEQKRKAGTLTAAEEAAYQSNAKKRANMMASLAKAEGLLTAVMAVRSIWQSPETGGFFAKTLLSIAATATILSQTASQVASIKASANFVNGGDASGLIRVGEQGPETLYLQGQGRVYNNHQTNKINNSKSQSMVVNLYDQSGDLVKVLERKARSGEMDSFFSTVKSRIA